MPVMRIDTELVLGKKTAPLCAELNDGCAPWYLMRLWAIALNEFPNGSFKGSLYPELERRCGWEGSEGRLLQALMLTGWVLRRGESFQLRGWDKPREQPKKAVATKAQPELIRVDAMPPVITAEPDDSEKVSRDATDAMCEVFEKCTGAKYLWNGAKDGASFSKLIKAASMPEIVTRWKRGLMAPEHEWHSVRTVSQLLLKWNDLAKPTSNETGEAAPSRRL